MKICQISKRNGGKKMQLKLKTASEISTCKAAQSNYCAKKRLPHFAPASGNCYRCGKNIYQNMGWKNDPPYSKIRVEKDGEEVDFITGVSLEKASSELITGCPHCHRSYCD
jgi:hypothetical protein